MNGYCISPALRSHVQPLWRDVMTNCLEDQSGNSVMRVWVGLILWGE